jgi:hypothetical protein
MKQRTKEILITKASGESLPFSEEKLMASLIRAGASQEVAHDIAAQVRRHLHPGIPTKKIYRIAFALLKQYSKPLAAKYHLKRAIMELGPSGFPFEKFIGEILKREGYKIHIGEILKGQCVDHEIDVIAEKEDHVFLVECKYHNKPGTICDVKVPLYIRARFKDVEAVLLKKPAREPIFYQGWLATNTHFSKDAIAYGTCVGLRLLGWDFPKGKSLRHRIDQWGLYPLTCLTSLSKMHKQKLLEKRIVLCEELLGNDRILQDIGIKPSLIRIIKAEALELIQKKNGSMAE